MFFFIFQFWYSIESVGAKFIALKDAAGVDLVNDGDRVRKNGGFHSSFLENSMVRFQSCGVFFEKNDTFPIIVTPILKMGSILYELCKMTKK